MWRSIRRLRAHYLEKNRRLSTHYREKHRRLRTCFQSTMAEKVRPYLGNKTVGRCGIFPHTSMDFPSHTMEWLETLNHTAGGGGNYTIFYQNMNTCLLLIVCALRGDNPIFPRNFQFFFCSCHNFFSLSSVQIIFIPACCLLCVL